MKTKNKKQKVREISKISLDEIKKYQEQAEKTKPVHKSATEMPVTELVSEGSKLMMKNGFKISDANLDSYEGFKEGEAEI